MIERLEQQLGPCLREDRKATFCLKQDDFDPDAVRGERVESVRRRRPNLNDVFLWVNR